MQSPDTPTCPRCQAPRVQGPECPRCGVIYAKAQRRAQAVGAEAGDAAVVEEPPDSPGPAPATVWDDAGGVATSELTMRLVAIPLAVAVAWWLVTTGPGHMLVRTFLSMWVHEIGHAVAAWLCGFPAFPGPWFTPVAPQRSVVFALIVAGALGGGAYWHHRAGRRLLAALLGLLLVLQGIGTLGLSPSDARAFLIFFGDGGCLVLGTLLMLSVYAPAEGAIRRGWLHLGFLVIGAAAYADAFEQWLGARRDPDRIPFGANEGRCASDASTLVEVHEWSETALVRRFVTLGVVCAVVLAVAWFAGVESAWRRRRAARAAPGAPAQGLPQPPDAV